jgi:hypothetical protein
MRTRRNLWIALLAAGVFGSGSALAVSDGQYDPAEQGCSDFAANSDRPEYTEPDCRTLIFKVSDRSHTYVSVGIPQTPSGTFANALELCIDLGTGTKNCAIIDRSGITPLPPKQGTPRKAGAAHVYFGADDNLDAGEHDSSEQVDNGPSDGGAIVANVTPGALKTWLQKSLASGNGHYYLKTHPLPIADTGAGACADGLCFSVTTQRRVAYQGGRTDKHQDVSNYQGKEWDPESCSGPRDEAEDCGGVPLSTWEEKDGTFYTEPGIQVYEDPDPQGSPLDFAGYPIPAFYVGTCGFVAGGGKVQAPDSPYTNDAGQLRIGLGC